MKRQPKTAKVDMELSALVEQYVELGEEISEMQEIREGIKEQIMERVGSEPVIAGEYVVYDEETSTLTVYVMCCPDIGAYVKLLDDLGFTFIYIDGDSCEAELEGEYAKVFEVMRMLEQEGFTW